MFRTLLFSFCLSTTALCSPASNAHLERAALLEAQGRIEQATAEFKAAVESAARSTDPTDLVRTLDFACAHYQDIGQTVQSEPCLRRLLTVSTKLLGPGNLSLNRIVNRLACVYIELRRPGQAERLQLGKWLARLESEAPLSTDRIDLLGALAALELIRGNPSQSAALNLEAWAIIEKRGETETASAITALNNLAIAYREAKRYQESEDTLLRALAIGDRAGFTDTLPMAYTYANLAYVSQSMRRYPAAERHIARTLAIVELRCGPSSPRFGALLDFHASVLRKLGRKREARAAESRARTVSAFTGHSVDIADLARRR